MAGKQKNKVTDDMEILPKVKRELKLDLDAKESKAKMDEAVECQQTKDETEKEKASLIEEHKAALEPLNQTIKDSDQRIAHLLRELGEGKSITNVECEPVANYHTKKMEFWYPNFAHGSKKDERDFTTEEHQKRMFQNEADAIPCTGSDPAETEARA